VNYIFESAERLVVGKESFLSFAPALDSTTKQENPWHLYCYVSTSEWCRPETSYALISLSFKEISMQSKMRIMIAAAGALMLMIASLADASDIYIVQNTAGADNGADCSNAHSAAWFNSNATGGNTYHLCGTFAGIAGSTMLTPPSGSPGNTLTVLFESGAMLTAPYWGSGAININGRNYISIDGGTNGVIQNTTNGTSLANQEGSDGIHISSAINIEIKNLTIQNIYVNGGSSPGATDAGGSGTTDINVIGTNSNISIHDNTLSNSRTGVNVTFDSSAISNISIYNNYVNDHCWSIAVRAGNGGETSSNIAIYNNTITGWANWQYPTTAYHTDGIILYQPSTDTSIFAPQIYNNYIYGDLGAGSPTAFVFCTCSDSPPTGSGGANSCAIFNNLFVNTGPNNDTQVWLETGSQNNKIYNNTFVGYSSSSGHAIVSACPGNIIDNNIVENFQSVIGSYDTITSDYTTINYNVYFNIDGGPSTSMFSGNDGRNWYTWSQWQALRYDANSSTSDPNLNSSYRISSASGSAYQAGANLTSLGITALNSDKVGTPRPGSGAWDIGAYEYSSTTIPAPVNLHLVQ
jgi:hypothetical protein